MKIKVLHVIDHLGYGGAPIALKNIVEHLNKNNYDSLVCALRTNPEPIDIDARVISLTCARHSPLSITAIAQLCKKNQIDIIHAHLQKSIVSSLFASFFCEARVIIHEHGAIFRSGTGCIYRLLLRLLRSRIAVPIANSKAVQSALAKVTGLPAESIPVVGNFVDAARFDPSLYDRDRTRASLGTAKEDVAVGFVGRLDRCKGADILIEAAALLKNAETKCKFIIVGEGPERPALQEQVRKLSLADSVIFTGLHKNPAEIIRAFDMAVMPSRREAFGIVAIEYMLMKIPVIAAPTGGLPELIQDRQTGILLEKCQPQAIADAVRLLADEQSLAAKLTDSAREFAGQYTGGAQLPRLEHIYTNAVASHNPDKA
jgi:glycosyltransferase involved in cell wall biosynthesis